MGLSEEYRRQFAWRSWNQIFEKLPLAAGQVVLDLGCGVGDQARELAARGASIIGIDMNQELIDAARSQRLSNCEFRCGDLRNLHSLDMAVDGIWCSFTAAYFRDLPSLLKRWRQDLHPAGWIAITEVDNLFGHEPLSARTEYLLHAYAEDTMAAGRYDFRMGAKIGAYLSQSGYEVSQTLTLPDQELSFDGRSGAAVIQAWQARFDRMKLLQEFCGSEFAAVRDEFVACLTRADHFATARVVACIANKGTCISEVAVEL
jgi:ubiquinone/menaquinone biosynthesis C-methylase UbiE